MAQETNQTQEPPATASPSPTQTAAPADLADASLASSGAEPVVAAPTRPEGLADDFWDAEKGVKVPELVGKYKELEAIKAEVDARKAQIPAKPDDYKLELPADMKLPEGVELNPADPRLSMLRELSHQEGIGQGAFSKIVAAEVQYKAQQLAELGAAKAAEIAKLGPNAGARVDAITQFFNGTSKDAEEAKAMSKMLVSAKQVDWFERNMKARSSQGVDTLRNGGRVEAPAPGEIEGFDRMGFEQRLAAQDAQKAQQRRA